MTKVLLIAAGLGLAVSGAQACEFQRTAKADRVDNTTVSSVTLPQSEAVAMSEPAAEKPQVETVAE